MYFPWRQFLVLAWLNCFTVSAFAATPKVAHTPEQPKSGETVHITARFKPPFPARVEVQYQVVEPGGYIALSDPAFKTNWVSLPMKDAAGVFSAELPGSLQTHRRLVRYRIVESGRVVAPAESEAVPNLAYFVYDGIPPWRAAINPSSPAPALREVRTFGTNVMRSVPAYHLIAKKTAVENTAWYQPAPWGNEAARKAYNYTGTFIADDGKVYDHVGFRARGGSWRYTMGKTMWKFDFNPGHHLAARDDFGEPYQAKWDKLNLGACIQHGDYGRRGEQGMYEAVSFKLFNLAGVDTARTHWVQLRIIDGAEESPANQYGGDFWGLYLATENLDDAFLKEHELPPGNLYKLEFGQPDLHTHTKYEEPNNADIRQFMAGYQKRPDESWWRANLDLPHYYSYRAILECVHHYDVYTGKNYFYYHNPHDNRWSVLPWDLDHSWGDRMHGNGMEPFMVLGLPSRAPFKVEYQNRLREIRDLLFNPEQMDALIDGHAALIANPNGGLSFVDADRAQWDYNPIMVSRYVNPSKAGQGRFYEAAPTKDFRGMVQMMKDYVRTRGAWVDDVLLDGPDLPATPSVENGPLNFSGPELVFRVAAPTGEKSAPTIQWRVAEVAPGSIAPRQNQPYEIVPLWRTNGPVTAHVPVSLLEADRTYRVRARAQDADGRAGHWSAPVQFTVPR